MTLEGKLLWQFQARSEIVSAPVVKDSRVVFASSDDRLYSLDANTGERLWTYSRGTYKTVTHRVLRFPGAFRVTATSFTFSPTARLCACQPRQARRSGQGKLSKEFTSQAQPRRSPLVDSGTVYMIDGNHAVVALSELTGEVKGIYNVIKASRTSSCLTARSIVIAGEGQVMSIDRSTGAVIWKSPLSHGAASSVFSTGASLFVLSNFKKTPLGISYFAKDTGYIESFSLMDGKRTWGRELGSSVTADASAAIGRVALLTNGGKLTVFEPGQAP